MIELFNIEAEQSVLGSLLIDFNKMEIVSEILIPEDFYEPSHQNIYKYLIDVFEAGKKTNAVLIKEFFGKDDAVIHVGGPGYIPILVNMGVVSINIKQFANTVKELSVKREALDLSKKLKDLVENETEESYKILDKIKDDIDKLEDKTGFEDSTQSFKDIVVNHLVHLTNVAENGNVGTLSSGFIDFDREFGNLCKGELFVLAGRPAMGKSSISLQIALNISKKSNVILFSEEMTKYDNTGKSMASFSKINSNKIKYNLVSKEEIKKLGDVMHKEVNRKLFINDKSFVDVPYMRKVAKRIKRKHGDIGVIILDYIQISKDHKNNKNRVQAIGNITMGLKNLAKEFDCTVIALSQLSRAVEQRENKRPMLSDLRESGSIEQDADRVVFCYRPYYYLEKQLKHYDKGTENYNSISQNMEQTKNLCELIVEKNRHGRCGSINLDFYPEYSILTNSSK